MEFQEFGKIRNPNKMLSLDNIIQNYQRKRLKTQIQHKFSVLPGPQPQHTMPPPKPHPTNSLRRLSESFKQIPCSHEAVIVGHTQTVSAFGIDKFGARMATGSDDFTVRLWDFYGMNKTMNSFRIMEPQVQQQIRAISWSPTSSHFLICTQGNSPCIFSREGEEIVDCVTGDMYLRDLARTKGHTSLVTDGQWHPQEKNHFITSSMDTTVRIWDASSELYGLNRSLKNSYIIKLKNKRGRKLGVTTCRYTKSGKLIVAAGVNGSIQFYSIRTRYLRPDFRIESAHRENQDITSICFFKNDKNFLTRAQDNTMKL